MKIVNCLILVFASAIIGFPQTSYPNEITINAWKSEFWKNLRTEYCGEEAFLKNCFDHAPSTCEMKFQKSFLQCEKKLIKIQKLNPVPEGVELGRKMGRCIAKDMIQSAEPQKKPMCKKRRGLLE